MLLLVAVLGGLLLLLLLLLFIPTRVDADYLYNEKKQKFRIRLRLLGLPFSFDAPSGKKKKGKEKSKEKKILTPKEYIEYAKNLYEGYQAVKDDFCKVLSEIKQKLACRDAYLTVHYGTKNPAVTGMLNGAVWTASSLLLKIIDEAFGAEKKTLDVRPDFQNVCMCLHIKGTFCFKLFDAIRLVLKIREMVNIVKSYASRQKTDNVS